MNLKLKIAAVALLAAGCATYNNISSDYDRSIDFTRYKTYAWLNSHQPHAATPYDNEIIENNFKNYVDHELASRNYQVDTGLPDLLFELVLSNQKKIRTTNTTTAVPLYNSYSPGSYRYYNPSAYRWNAYGYTNYNYVRPQYQINNQVIQTEYNRSTITINVFDRVLNKEIWTGTAEGDIYDNRYVQNEMHPAIDAILKQYPLKPLKK